MVIPKKSGGVRITVNYKKLNQISKLSQLPIPRVDQVLDSLDSGRMFSLFDLVSSFIQIKAHKDTVPLTAFCTPTGLYEWLVMPQSSSASPGRFVKAINEVFKDLKQVAAYLDDVIAFDSDPIAHVQTIRSLFERLRKHNLSFPPQRLELPGPLHFPGGCTAECRKSVENDQYADAHGCEAGPCINGWHQLLPQIFARLVQEASSD